MTDEGWSIPQQSLTRASPHRLGGSTHQDIVRAWLFAAGLVGLCGTVLYGPAALKTLLLGMVSAVVTEAGVALATRRQIGERLGRGALIGLLLGLTLPATVPGYVTVVGSVISILVGRVVFGGFLNPALTGRVIVQFLFAGHLSLSGALAVSPVLALGHQLVGDITRGGMVQDYQGWFDTRAPIGKAALLLERPVQALRRFAQDGVAADGDLHYTPLLRDVLPPWQDTLFGVVPGGIGETPTLMLIVAGLYLIYRGYLRWQLPAVVLASAAVAASILPVQLGGTYHWFPVLAAEQGHAVGLAYVLYHLTAGQLMLGAFLLAGDVTASPMRVHGQLVFAVGIGVLTIFMRLYGVLSGECYWSILIMNALVGTIDRWMKRPVLGMGDVGLKGI